MNQPIQVTNQSQSKLRWYQKLANEFAFPKPSTPTSAYRWGAILGGGLVIGVTTWILWDNGFDLGKTFETLGGFVDFIITSYLISFFVSARRTTSSVVRFFVFVRFPSVCLGCPAATGLAAVR